MKGLILHLLKVSGIAFILIWSISSLFIITVLQSTSNFQYLQQSSKQLGVTNKAEYEVLLLVSNFYLDMVYHNNSRMLMRNEPLLTQLDKNFEAMRNNNKNLLAVFLGDNEQAADPIIDDILNDNVCDYLPQATYASCLQAVKNQKVGVLAINSNVVLQATNYFDVYLRNPTYVTAKSIFLDFATTVRLNIDTLQAAYSFINQHIQAKADDRVNSALTLNEVMFGSILAAIVICLAIIQIVTIRQYKVLDMSRGRILKLIPYQIVLENKALGYYLMTNYRRRDISGTLA